MKSDMGEKRIMEVDGEEYVGLINMDEYVIEDDDIEVPGRDKTITIRNGVMKIPPVNCTFKLQRNSATLKNLQDWYYQKQYKDVVIRRVDAGGNEFARELWPNTEIAKCHAPAYDALSPVPAQVLVRMNPEDIIPISAEV